VKISILESRIDSRTRIWSKYWIIVSCYSKWRIFILCQ